MPASPKKRRRSTAKRQAGNPKYASKNVKQLRKEANAKRKKECPPPVSKMKRAQLIAYLDK